MSRRILAARELLLACDKPITVRAIAALLQHLGSGARGYEITLTLRDAAGHIPDTSGHAPEHAGTQPGHSGKQDPMLFAYIAPSKKRVKRDDPRTPSERTADEAINAMRANVEPRLKGLTWSAWVQRNRRKAVEMIQSGMTAEGVCEAQKRTGKLTLYYVQEELNRVAGAKTNGTARKFDLEDETERARFEAEARAKQKAKATPMTEERKNALSSLGFTLAGDPVAPKTRQTT